MITLATKAGYDQVSLEENHPLIKLYPFDSERKRMSCVREIDGKQVLFVKGAPDSMIERCTMIMDQDGEREIVASDTKKLLEYNHERASHARRQLVFAYKILEADERR